MKTTFVASFSSSFNFSPRILFSTSVEVNPTSKFLQKGKRFTIKATVTSATATNKSVKWKSSKKSVASVTSKDWR